MADMEWNIHDFDAAADLIFLISDQVVVFAAGLFISSYKLYVVQTCMDDSHYDVIKSLFLS